MQRRIAHLDMDAFYAGVELLRYPQFKNIALVIGGRHSKGHGQEPGMRLSEYTGRGVATTATYEARALGVHSGMGLMKAAKLAPEAMLLPADFEQYTRYSRLFKAAVAEIAPIIEDRGIDEIYIDLTEHEEETAPLAQAIKDNVRRATGLSCSIGVAPNKLLAKIASELDKPDGLTILSAADVRARIWPLPARKINGIGPRAAAKLLGLGIQSIGELAQSDRALLSAHFGAHYGDWLLDAAHGIDERPVVTVREPKSISCETTFERDLDVHRDRELLSQILLQLCERLSGNLVRKGYLGKTVGVRLRYADFRGITRATTLNMPVNDAEAIRQAARTCLKRVRFDRKLRLLGVRIGALTSAHGRAIEVTAPDGDQPQGALFS
jgi:DNA polymerase-4